MKPLELEILRWETKLLKEKPDDLTKELDFELFDFSKILEKKEEEEEEEEKIQKKEEKSTYFLHFFLINKFIVF